MITVLSPAKKLSKECNAQNTTTTLPEFLDDSKHLVSILKDSKPGDLQSLMGISENLSILNWERYQNWKLPFEKSQSRQAVFTFQGDTYSGLNVDLLNEKELSFAQNHTRILSGLYGVLKPFDLMMPYRLEMGTKLKNKLGNNNQKFTVLGHWLLRKRPLFLDARIGCVNFGHFFICNLDKLLRHTLSNQSVWMVLSS